MRSFGRNMKHRETPLRFDTASSTIQRPGEKSVDKAKIE